MSRFALRLKGVTKRYGETRALDGLTLDVPSGALMGLVGPNGAGKTTTFGVVSGAVRPDAGQVDVLGQGPFDPARHAGRLTVLPQDCALNPSSSARQILTFHARLQGLTLKAAAREADRVLDLVHLADRGGARVGQLSHGMKRRLAVAQALLGDPELVLLDEPTGGLDPHLVVAMREILSAQRGRRTVVVSSHILADLEATCDHVAFLEEGRCTRSGPVAEVTRRGALVRIQLAEAIELAALEPILSGREASMEGDVLRYQLREGEDPAEVQRVLLPLLLEAGARVLEIHLGESLEAAYMSTRARSGR